MTAPAPAYLLVLVGGRPYGMPMSSVLEVATMRVHSAVPGVPDYIRGVVLFEDRPTPVIDPARFMGGALLELSERSCFVFVNAGEGSSVVAVLIENVVALVNAPLEPAQRDRDEETSPLLSSSCVMHQEERVAVMHLPALMEPHRPMSQRMPA